MQRLARKLHSVWSVRSAPWKHRGADYPVHGHNPLRIRVHSETVACKIITVKADASFCGRVELIRQHTFWDEVHNGLRTRVFRRSPLEENAEEVKPASILA